MLSRDAKNAFIRRVGKSGYFQPLRRYGCQCYCCCHGNLPFPSLTSSSSLFTNNNQNLNFWQIRKASSSSSSNPNNTNSSAAKKDGFFKSLRDSFREEIDKSPELKAGLENLQSRKTAFNNRTDVKIISGTLRGIKDGSVSIARGTKRGAKKLSSGISSISSAIGDSSVGQATSKTASGVASSVTNVVKPVIEHKSFDSIRQAADELIIQPSWRYGGVSGENRRSKIREGRLMAAGLTREEVKKLMKGETIDFLKDSQAFFADKANGGTVEEDLNAGSNIVMHKDSRWKEAWSSFKEGNPFVQGIFSFKKSVEESDNLLGNMYRAVSSSVGSLFEENETGAAIRQIKSLDPTFTTLDFLSEARNFIIPEIMEAYLSQNLPVLKIWCSEEALVVAKHSMEARKSLGWKIEAQILELRQVEVKANLR